MSKSIRTFIALKIGPQDELLRTINILKETFVGEKIKWVEPDNLHLTLKFLGDTPADDVEKIKEELERLAAGFQPFCINLHGLGFFKSKGQPKVLFANIEHVDFLKEVFSEIEVLSESFGFKCEARDFKPHLTLARIKHLKDKRNFYLAVEEFKNTEFKEVLISEIIFYQSKLQPDGPVYKPLKVAKLKQ